MKAVPKYSKYLANPNTKKLINRLSFIKCYNVPSFSQTSFHLSSIKFQMKIQFKFIKRNTISG